MIWITKDTFCHITYLVLNFLFPLALELAKTNQVHGIARFRDDSVKRLLEDIGVTIITKDVITNRWEDVPQITIMYCLNYLCPHASPTLTPTGRSDTIRAVNFDDVFLPPAHVPAQPDTSHKAQHNQTHQNSPCIDVAEQPTSTVAEEFLLQSLLHQPTQIQPA